MIRCTTAQGVSIGHSSTVGHNVTINDCVIGNQTLIGIGSTVAPGTTIGDRVLLAASARTTPGQVLESGWLYAGAPARKFARLDDAKQALTALIVHAVLRIRAGVRGAGTATLAVTTAAVALLPASRTC